MKTGKFLRRIAMLISAVMLITSTIGTTYGFVTVSTNPLMNVFVPEDVNVEGVTITKAVVHPLGQEYKIPEKVSFDFLIELGQYYANSRVETSAGVITCNEKGNFEMNLKPGESLTLEGIKEGTVVKVTEKETDLPGFSVRGDQTRTHLVEADGAAEINFINEYTPKAVIPTNVTVKGEKILMGRDWKADDEFTFRLDQKKNGGWVELGTKTVAYSEETAIYNRFDFSEIFQTLSFDEVGTYEFRMTEVPGNLENVDYDQTANFFNVLVTDVEMDGKLEINTVSGTENAAVTASLGSYSVSVTFNNTYTPPPLPDPEPITVPVEVVKKVNNMGEKYRGAEDFEFVLKNEETGERFVAISAKDGKAKFDLTYTKADIGKTYTYVLSETDLKEEGVTYDEDVYKIRVTVSLNKENELEATLTLDDQEVRLLRVIYKNVYDVKNAPQSGDRANLILWLIMMVVSATSLTGLIIHEVVSRKKEKA